MSGRRVVEVVLPQLGETVAEGTVLEWLVEPGDAVEADQLLCEISTDKVDTEIPSPAAGRVEEVLVGAGETVEVGTVLLRLSTEAAPGEGRAPAADGGVAAAGSVGTAEERRAGSAGSAAGSVAGPADEPLHFEHSTIDLFGGGSRATAAPGAPAREDSRENAAAGDVVVRGPGGVDGPEAARPGKEPGRPRRATPAVRRLAGERGVELDRVRGTGMGGRVTREDVLRHLEEGAGAEAGLPAARDGPRGTSGAPAAERGERAAPGARSAERVVELSPVRRAIARRMVESQRAIPHVTTVMEADLTVVAGIRNRTRTAFEERHGVRLTYMPFLAHATVGALEAHPVLNASLRDDRIHYHDGVHLGIAVATDDGLVVPVLHDAHALSFAGLAEGIADLSSRARRGDLEPADVQGGTFTLTNHGLGGSLMGTPIIVPPQTGILGLGKIEDAPKVMDGEIVVRRRCHLSLTFDHRALDGAQADAFLRTLVGRLAAFEASTVEAGRGAGR